MVLRSVYFMVKFRIFIPELWDFIHQIIRDFKAIVRMSHCKLKTPLPIHFIFRTVIGIDSPMVCILFGEISFFYSRVLGLYSSNCRRFFVCRALNWEPLGQFTSNFAVIGIHSLMVCILFGEISIFHSRVMELYSSNCRRFFVCRTVNWEPLGQFTSNFAQLLELIVLLSVYILVKFRFFIQELWERKSLQILYECWRRAYHALLAQLFISFTGLSRPAYKLFFNLYPAFLPFQ